MIQTKDILDYIESLIRENEHLRIKLETKEFISPTHMPMIPNYPGPTIGLECWDWAKKNTTDITYMYRGITV